MALPGRAISGTGRRLSSLAKCSRMLADLVGGHGDRTIGQRMREYTRPPVLIIDDFAIRCEIPTG